MKTSDFNKIVRARLNECNSILTDKGGRYNTKAERFTNFKRAASIKGITPIGALDGMMLKHLTDFEIVKEKMEADSTFVPSKKWLNERITDIINYTMLFEGLVEDRREKLKEQI